MKKNDAIDKFLQDFLLNKNLKISTGIAAINILYDFFTQLNVKKDTRVAQKEIKKHIKNQPLQALAVSFIVGWTVAGLIKKIT